MVQKIFLNIGSFTPYISEQLLPLHSKLKDRYRIKHKTGQGGMGVTYLAWDGSTMQDVVLKVIQFNELKNWKQLDLFQRKFVGCKHHRKSFRFVLADWCGHRHQPLCPRALGRPRPGHGIGIFPARLLWRHARRITGNQQRYDVFFYPDNGRNLRCFD